MPDLTAATILGPAEAWVLEDLEHCTVSYRDLDGTTECTLTKWHIVGVPPWCHKIPNSWSGTGATREDAAEAAVRRSSKYHRNRKGGANGQIEAQAGVQAKACEETILTLRHRSRGQRM